MLVLPKHWRFLTPCERARCHVGALNSHHATVQDVCAGCSFSDASERCSRKPHWQFDSSLMKVILSASRF